VESVVEFLNSEPELVDEWLRWSADKRTSQGYYFLVEDRHYVVGYFPGDERVKFDDPVLACANFVVKEINEIGSVL
jgi:hypothetical protein